MGNQTELFDDKNEYGALYDDRDKLCQSWQDNPDKLCSSWQDEAY